MKNISEYLKSHEFEFINKNELEDSNFKATEKPKEIKIQENKAISSNIISIFELIERYVIPKWKRYILSKTKFKEINHQIAPRSDTLWKKIIRDVREFYRILYRYRFNVEDFKNKESAYNSMSVFFE